ncbi:autotransporter outer membrane beta-barrel domain-containing protein [Kalamiella sp. sgz302252]|uniref:autotransporter family protein n=1 Tax=Pantoea sp. sgz302252 TaxID=3341827 RepID=UPI0036D3A8BA
MTTPVKRFPLSLLTLALFPLTAVAASPWRVTDGSTLQVTSGYSATEQLDYGLQAAGSGSQLITNKELVFETTAAATANAWISDGAALELNEATLISSGHSSDGVRVDNGSAIIDGSTIITAGLLRQQAGYAIYGNKAAITVRDTTLSSSSYAGEAIYLVDSTLQANNLTLTGSADNFRGGAINLNRTSATLEDINIALQGESADYAITSRDGHLDGKNITISTASTSMGGILVSGTEIRSTLTLHDSTINSVMYGLLAMGGDMTLNNVNVATSGDFAYAVAINQNSATVIRGGEYKTSGNYAEGIWLAGGEDKPTSLDAAETTISTSGDYAHAVNAQFGTAKLENSVLSTSGTSSYALTSSVNTTGDGLTLLTTGAKSHGVVAFGSSEREGVITLTHSDILTSGDNAMGVAGMANTSLILNDVDIKTQGTYGSHALMVNKGKASLSASVLATEGESSYGLYLSGGSATINDSAVFTAGKSSLGLNVLSSTLEINNTEVVTSGDQSTGLSAINAAAVSADNLTLKVSGKGTYALASSQSELSFRNSKISGEGSEAIGLSVSGPENRITLDNTSLSSTGYAVYVQGETAGDGLDLTLKNGSTLYSGNGIAIRSVTASADASETPLVNIAADNSQIEGDILASSGTINLALTNGSVLNGAATGLSQLTLDSASRWLLTGSSGVDTLAQNGGTLVFSPPSSFTTLNVNGNLSGSGSFVLNTRLGDDSSATDKILIGGNASGSYGVTINNQGGTGAATSVGIPVINVAGDAQAASFTQSNTLVAGNYQYVLNKVSDHDWYLQSSLTPVIPGSADTPTQNDNDSPPPASASETPAVTAYRPETAGYIVSPLLNATYGFATAGNWHARESAYKNDAVWGRIAASHERYSAGRFAYDVNTAYVQFGGDLLQRNLANNWHLYAGPMATIGHQRSGNKDKARDIRPELSVDVGKNSLRAYGVGGYLTALHDSGAYIDGIMQATRYSNEFSSLTSGKTHSYGVTLSADTGLPVMLGQSFTLEPHLQASAQYLNFSESKIEGVKLKSQDLLLGQLREGVRLSYNHAAVKPYIQADVVQWLGATPGVQMNGETLKPEMRRNHWQAGAGLSGQLTPQLRASAQVNYSHSFGAGLEGYSGNLGLEYQF